MYLKNVCRIYSYRSLVRGNNDICLNNDDVSIIRFDNSREPRGIGTDSFRQGADKHDQCTLV